MNESFELHDTLNPVLWENDSLRPDVEEILVKIVDEYISNSDILKETDIIDAELVGSNASFNYTDKSDLDLHLIVNMEDISCDPAMVQIACNAERSIFNKNYDLSVKGIDVELYVEDVKSSTASNGVYSLFKNEWIKYPEKIESTDYSTDNNFLSQLSDNVERIKATLSSSGRSIEIQDEINNLYNMRRESIMTDGEFGFGNQMFKEIRNLGLLDDLKNKKYELTSKELSLESMKREQFMTKTYRVNYLLKEDFHYSLMDADDPMLAAKRVYDYFDNSDDYEFLGVEEVKPTGPSYGPDAGLSEMIINAINDEWETISVYNSLAITAREEGREDIARVIDDINQEENKHVGQLQEVLKLLSPVTNEIESGEEEGKEQLEKL